MSSCYLCGEELTESNCSVEHIIPNYIGGKLKSNMLLCWNCNSTSGSEIDIAFSMFIPIQISKFDFKRDRGKTPDFIAKDSNTGEDVIVSKGIKLAYLQPRITQGDNIISISAPNLKRARQEVERWKKQFGQGKTLLSETITVGPGKKIDVVHSAIINPDLLIRAVAKIVTNYFIFRTGEKALCTLLIPFIKNEMENNYGWTFDLDLCKHLHQSKPKHIIIIKGDKKGKAIYSYIELFGEVGFVILINGRYIGEDFQLEYTFDLTESKEEEYHYNLAIKAGDVINIIINKPEGKLMKRMDVFNPVNSK